MRFGCGVGTARFVGGAHRLVKFIRFAVSGRQAANHVDAGEGEIDNGFSLHLLHVFLQRVSKLLLCSGRGAVGFTAELLILWGITTPLQFHTYRTFILLYSHYLGSMFHLVALRIEPVDCSKHTCWEKKGEPFF